MKIQITEADVQSMVRSAIKRIISEGMEEGMLAHDMDKHEYNDTVEPTDADWKDFGEWGDEQDKKFGDPQPEDFGYTDEQ